MHIIFIVNNHRRRGKCSVNWQFSGNQMLHVPLFPPMAGWILPTHHEIILWVMVLVCMLLLWTDFFFLSLWCQLPFLCWWYSCICLWFLTTLFFPCLADIKSLMFQNHIQLKLWETECLVSSSLNMRDDASFLLFQVYADLQFHFKQVSWGLSLIDNCFSWSHIYENLPFITKTLLACRKFSPLPMQEGFQSWFLSFRLNYQEAWPFLKAGYLNSKTGDLSPLLLTLTTHHCIPC